MSRRDSGARGHRNEIHVALLALVALIALLLTRSAGAQPVSAGPRSGVVAAESLPALTLEDAVARATRHDPTVAEAAGRVGDAVWLQRVARASLVLPSVTVGMEAARFSTPAFNPGTLTPGTRAVTAQVQASYDLSLGGRQLANLRRARTVAGSAEALETQARFELRRATTADYFGVVSARELHRVAADRARRAEEQLAAARARVKLGAAVPTDSLQLALELTRARVALVEREAALHVARLQLGRRVGVAGPADAAAADTVPPAALPLSMEEALARALAVGPTYTAARAAEQAAAAALAAERSAYFPRLTIAASASGYDDALFPRAAHRSQIGVGLSLPLWDNGQRELAIAQARTARDVAEVRRRDLERGAVQAVAEAYTGFTTALAGIELATAGVAVARETYRVQDVRYRTGATTVLDVLEAQNALSRAEADLVQARLRARLSLAQLESILGQRLTSTDTVDHD